MQYNGFHGLNKNTSACVSVKPLSVYNGETVKKSVVFYDEAYLQSANLNRELQQIQLIFIHLQP